MSDIVILTCSAIGLPKPVAEYTFHEFRRWRIDYAFPDVKLAIEIEGGAFSMGRHTRPIGFIKDMEKYNALTLSKWSLLRYIPKKINYDQIKEMYFILKNN
jgi:very-short-patch-repair endonuclease